jgi:hypothetical protein
LRRRSKARPGVARWPRLHDARHICRTDTAAVQAEDITYVLGSLQTRVYDPLGNLRKADDQTTYGPTTNSR